MGARPRKGPELRGFRGFRGLGVLKMTAWVFLGIPKP